MKISPQSFRAYLWLLVIAFVAWLPVNPAIATASTAHAGGTPAMVRLPGHVLPALSTATVVPSKSDSDTQPITLTLVFKHDDQPAFEHFLHGLYDPKSRNFHHFLTQQQIADRFGPSRGDYDAVFRWMTSKGFSVERGSVNRLTLTMSGTRAEAERAFDVRIGDYAFRERSFYANDRDPALPTELASSVQAVEGLSNFAEPRRGPLTDKIAVVPPTPPATPPPPTPPPTPPTPEPTPPPPPPPITLVCSKAQASLCSQPPVEITDPCLRVKALIACYTACLTAGGQVSQLNGTDVATLLAQYEANDCTVGALPGLEKSGKPVAARAPAFDGTGQTVALVEFDSFVSTDVSNYLALLGLEPTLINNLSKVDVNGGVAPGTNQDEVLLDIDAVLTVAPGASIVVYDAPFDGRGSFQAVLNQMLDNNKITIISNSWAYCEDQTTLADVQSIDTIFQNAAAANITVFNGAGDSGSTCLDGTANTISVPADSPNATAVGGSSLTTGPGNVYQSETWWNGLNGTPPTGQGGFGTSKFFVKPPYQSGSAMRSIPDVVFNADPAAEGVTICQATGGGCPTNSLYGGTSDSTPIWAAITATLNQAVGHNLGALNATIYPLGGTGAFHGPAAMNPVSDFAHVGLGSPNVDALELALTGQSVGEASATMSQVNPEPLSALVPAVVQADGVSPILVDVTLKDANGHSVSGKTVSLAANGGSSAKISPASAVTRFDGTAVFSVTDAKAEQATFTANDTSDGLALTPALTPTVFFVTPPATSASIEEAPPSVNNDGKSTAAITVALQYSLSSVPIGAQGKLVYISQTGNSVISGPNPQVTDSNGNIEFTATDLALETVTYTAVDVTDGNLAIPGSVTVDFTGSPSNTCGSGLPPAAPGFVVTPYATGFSAQPITTGGDGGINFGCQGATGIAFDGLGNLYVNEFPTGNIYKFPPGGGAAGPTTQLNSTSLGVTLAGLAFDSSGDLFASLDLTSGAATTGAVMQIDPSNGTVTRTIASGIPCPTAISIDPLSGDLFTDDTCTGAFANGSIWRVSGPGGGSPSTSVYTTLATGPNATLAFAPGGTIYGWAIESDVPRIAEISGTNGPTPPTVSVLPGIQLNNLGLLAGGPGAGTFLIATPFVNDAVFGLDNIDLTTSPLTLGTSLSTKSGANYLTFGPDGCIYGSQAATVFKITDAAGDCAYGAALGSPTLALSPASASPNPAQGTSQTLVATLHYASPLAGAQVAFNVSGANPQVQQVTTNANGQASFSYVGGHQGVDTIGAVTTVGSTPIASNDATVTWGPGSDSTFMTLNQSPKGAIEGQTVNLIASLFDVSQNPATPVAGETVNFTAGSQTCGATTNAQGVATCAVTASGLGIETQSASFSGGANLLGSNASDAFTVITLATSTPTATPTATATATATATPTATPTPVVGKIKISPKTLNFGDVTIGASPIKSVKVVNAGKVKKKKVPLPVLIEMESGVASPFTVTAPCDDDDLGPKAKHVPPGSCEVSVKFTPTEAIKYKGTLIIDTNLESKPDRSVKLEGTGKAPKK